MTEVGSPKQREQVRALTEDFTKLQAKITEIQGLLKQEKEGRLSLSAEQVKLLNIELAEAKKQFQGMLEPANKTAQAVEKLATAGDLKRQIDQLTAYIATHKSSAEAMAIAQAQLEKLQDKYNELTMSQLPNAVKEYRLLNAELERQQQRLDLVRESLSPDELRLAEAAITTLKDQVVKLNEAWLPPDVQQYRELTRELERLKTRMSEVTDPAELRLFQSHIVGLEVEVKKLARTMTEQLVDEALENWDSTLSRINTTVDTAIKKNADLIKSDYELKKALATTPEAVTKAYDEYIAKLTEADVKAEDIAKEQKDRAIEVAQDQKKAQEKAVEEFERFQEKVADDVSDVFFDFTKALTDGSIRMKDILERDPGDHQRYLLADLDRYGRPGAGQADPHSSGGDHRGWRDGTSRYGLAQ